MNSDDDAKPTTLIGIAPGVSIGVREGQIGLFVEDDPDSPFKEANQEGNHEQ